MVGRACLLQGCVLHVRNPRRETCSLVPTRRQLQEAMDLSLLKRRFLPHLSLKWIEEELLYVQADERQRCIQRFRLAGIAGIVW